MRDGVQVVASLRFLLRLVARADAGVARAHGRQHLSFGEHHDVLVGRDEFRPGARCAVLRSARIAAVPIGFTFSSRLVAFLILGS